MNNELSLRQMKQRRIWRESVLKGFAYFILLSLGITMMMPLAWMIATSLKDESEVFTYQENWLRNFIPTERERIKVGQREYEVALIKRGKQKLEVAILEYQKKKAKVRLIMDKKLSGAPWLVNREALQPKEHLRFRWENYLETWKAISLEDVKILFWRVRQIDGFVMFYLNSLFISISITFGQVFTSALAAYAFARLQFPGRDKLFLAYIATMMIPSVVTMIPVFCLLRIYRLIDTYYAVILPGLFSAYGTFMLRQFFITIPKELEEAAKIDGCSKWGIFWNIILPLSKPALATLTTFVFLYSWNDFMWPLIVLQSPEKMTLPVAIQYFQGLYQTQYTFLMAASVIVMVPVLIVFIFNQRYFVRGIMLSGLKA